MTFIDVNTQLAPAVSGPYRAARWSNQHVSYYPAQQRWDVVIGPIGVLGILCI
jgi:hypothetical protein